jgi:2-polyprenyl-3-methyl-5-hydroxy-6-metoxy-1,4-benzoquinol methylase
MQNSHSDEVAKTLKTTKLHGEWEQTYRSKDNLHFYEMALDEILSEFSIQTGSHFLDAGCGSGTKSIILAEKGFAVTGVDISDSVLETASKKAADYHVQDTITFQQESLLELSFYESSFDCVLCWGVLMHVPEVEKAISELIRVVQPGGLLIISEGNMNALQARLTRTLKWLLRRRESVRHTPAGIESWVETEAGKYLTRQANIQWIIDTITQQGMTLVKHSTGEFSEMYVRSSSPLIRSIIHRLNAFWYKRVTIASLAFGNLLVFQRND